MTTSKLVTAGVNARNAAMTSAMERTSRSINFTPSAAAPIRAGATSDASAVPPVGAQHATHATTGTRNLTQHARSAVESTPPL